MSEREALMRAIAALEAQRRELGDETVDSALGMLRSGLAQTDAADRPPGAMRKLVTALLADVCGYSQLAAAMDAEELGDLMNELWTRVDAVITAHGGVLDKHVGDAVMALWGVERVRESDPEQAVRAALQIHREVASLAGQLDRPLSMRIGVNTGIVLLGNVGTVGEFSAMGQTVNVTNRLERAAAPGGLLVSAETYRHVRGLFDASPVAPVAVEGRAEPMGAYSVTRAKARGLRAPARGVEGVQTLMVGRDESLGRLQRLLLQAFESSRTRTVTVLGEAGIGKSRLVYELERWIDRQGLDPWVLKGRALPGMEGAPLSVLRDLLATRFDILETDSTAVVREKLRDGMSDALGAEQADLVGHVVGFDLSESDAVAGLLDSPSFGRIALRHLTRYLEAAATDPTLLVLEDLHWADDSSLDYVATLSADIADGRLLIVCVARPQLLERRPDWCRVGAGDESPGDARHRLLELGPLSDADCGFLVRDILRRADGPSEALRERIVASADGNPYYVEELIKRMIDDGVIVCAPGRWLVDGDRLTEITVPSTLEGVLQARLDGLPARTKLVLQRAAVIGRTFWDSAVAELAGDSVSHTELEGCLEELSRRELIFPRSDSAFEGTREYAFKHALLRDVTYDTVLLKERRRYHDQAARWLEARAGHRALEFLGTIGAHFQAAGRGEAAARCLGRHAEELRRVSAYRDAIAVGERALALLPPEDRSGRSAVLSVMGDAQRQRGDYPAAVELLSEALQAAQSAGRSDVATQCLVGLGLTLRVQGRIEEAENRLRESLSLARLHDDASGAARALHALGDAAYRRGDAATAASCAQESLRLYTALGDRQGMAYALRVLGFAALLGNDHAAATAHQTESRELFASIGDRWGVSAGYINLGEIERRRGRYGQAAEHYRRALEIASETGSEYEVAVCENNLGHAVLQLGRRDEAAALLGSALGRARAMGVPPILLEASIGMAALRASEGRPALAADIVGLAMLHPAWSAEIGEYAGPILEELRSVLGAAELEARLSRPRSDPLPAIESALAALAGVESSELRGEGSSAPLG